jgi:uncharacterized radical SAM superfamily Fe-S cluster-containing enzyme
VFLGQTTSLCEDCLTLVPAKIVRDGEAVLLHKRCPQHGPQQTLISSDYAYWKLCREFLRPGDLPLHFHSPIDRGCPWDCGLCPDHEQHSCLALLEVTDACNLRCPVCFAKSGPERQSFRPLAEVEAMLDALVASEGQPDLVQISGGEPTLHPEILAILRAAKARPIRHVMLNTNGLRLAEDPAFVAELAALAPGFEVYLQCDSLRREGLMELRGADLRAIHDKALAALDAQGLSTTLVAVINKGINDDEVGELIRYALSHRCVRGVTFQPVQEAGRAVGCGKDNRVLLSDIRRAVIAAGPFGDADMIPLPCNPEAIAIGYALRTPGGGAVPVTGLIPREELLRDVPNAVTFESRPELRARLKELLSLSCAGPRQATALKDVLCCLPRVEVFKDLTYDRVFRVSIVSFLDRFNFDLGGVKRSCIHVVQPDGRVVPLDTWNLFHREAGR